MQKSLGLPISEMGSNCLKRSAQPSERLI